jgi:isopentenyl-diphosphate delta-isomerase
MDTINHRKKDHIELALKSQITPAERDRRFHYEPMLQAHPCGGLPPTDILGKQLKVPLWVSSMTGGTQMAGIINLNLARACQEFGMGMGLGSCRILLEDDSRLGDFQMRKMIGDDFPLWANLGIAQIEQLLAQKRVDRITSLVEKLHADGLIVHVNPLQEWIQPEGDVFSSPPLETIKRLLDQFTHPVIVKEVGQGMGPVSLKELLQLPLQALEFAAFGGTNFSRVESFRNGESGPHAYDPFAQVGEDAYSMLDYVNQIVAHTPTACKELIISGGIKDFLDGYYLINTSTLPAIYGMASSFLQYARKDYDQLREFVLTQIRGLEMAYAYLSIKK